MIRAILSDFSRVVLQPKDKNYFGGLNDLYKKHKEDDNFIFSAYFKIDDRVLNLYASLRSKIPVYVFTTDEIQEAPEIRDKVNALFERVFSAKQMNLSKKDSTSYEQIALKIGLEPNAILYIDDSEENVECAKKAGMQTVLYNNFEDLTKKLEELG